jgi:NADPH:quinone reductase-like Zn-dependent oxidoreductase
MKITPTSNFCLVRMRDLYTQNLIKLLEGVKIEPYGEVVAVGPDCKTVKVGDRVLFVPEAYVAGFDQGNDERFIISEGSVFGFIDLDVNQDGSREPKIVKTPPEAA